VADWPTVDADAADVAAEVEVAALIDLVRAVRNARSEARIEPAAWLPLDVYVPDSLGPAFEALRPAIERLARAKPLGRALSPETVRRGVGRRPLGHRRRDRGGGAPCGPGRGPGRARPRPPRTRAGRAQGLLAAARARLANEAFVSKAPPAVVEAAKARAAELEELVARLAERGNR